MYSFQLAYEYESSGESSSVVVIGGSGFGTTSFLESEVGWLSMYMYVCTKICYVANLILWKITKSRM